ncbi:hypothetical protein FBQ96_02485 [Nitrospirales bacterium NOB]|nr:hypothetical protein [Nitrospira sp. NTP2]MDL1888444.1 hypothetical protein [Nitrospirales bacterium NOB]
MGQAGELRAAIRRLHLEGIHALKNHKQAKNSDSGQLSKIMLDLGEDPLPRDPAIGNALIKSLLQNLRRLNPKQGRAVSNLVLMICTLEAIDTQLRPIIDALLERIARPEPERHAHWKEILQFQRRWLEDFLKKSQFISLTPTQRRQWFEKNQNHVHSSLSRIGCVCRYRKDLSLARDPIETASGYIQVVIHILSALHRSPISTGDPYNTQIYKLLKKTSS